MVIADTHVVTFNQFVCRIASTLRIIAYYVFYVICATEFFLRYQVLIVGNYFIVFVNNNKNNNNSNAYYWLLVVVDLSSSSSSAMISKASLSCSIRLFLLLTTTC